jgi:hypothetical protein
MKFSACGEHTHLQACQHIEIQNSMGQNATLEAQLIDSLPFMQPEVSLSCLQESVT